MCEDVVGDVCDLLEVIETEQVVEILEESHFLDLAAATAAAPMETGGEMSAGGGVGSSDLHEAMSSESTAEETQQPGQKRKRVYEFTTNFTSR